MPELPEVETVARELNRAIHGQKILAVETSWPKLFSRSPGGLARARRELTARTIKKVVRSGKRIFIYLSNDILWITHLKMTGAFLWGGKAKENRFVRAKFRLSRGTLYFSDIRKFGRMIVGKCEAILKHKDIVGLAPDPFQISHPTLRDALRKKSIPIKQALLDQKVIAGIGNIYADEILWASKIHPLLSAHNINEKNIKSIIAHARRILKKSIKYGGTSMRDFKNTKGEKGGYLTFCNVYMRENKNCRRNCGDTINRIMIGSRSTRFCPKCQSK
ncbi:MAG TPA: bifunctional DNA-formamidopyrimidine glycosylase/DNA-(apurinic or apyrimidinic site) lyase [Candidatus Paceibacterota bacterium]